MKKGPLWFLGAGCLIYLTGSLVPIFAEENTYMTGPSSDKDKVQNEYQPKTVIKTYKGVRFDVPEDRPIKDYDGYIAPIPLDEYVYMKFEKIGQRIDAMEKRVNDLEEKIKKPAPSPKS